MYVSMCKCMQYTRVQVRVSVCIGNRGDML